MNSSGMLHRRGLVIALAGILSSTSGCVVETYEEGVGDGDIGEESVGEASQALSWGGHSYLFILSSQTWDQAASNCATNGYYLVIINSATEEAWLAQQESAKAGGLWWLGYNDKGYEGVWNWVGGSSGWTNWTSGQPDDYFWSGGEDCAVDNWSAGKWNDVNCGSTAKIICERDY